MPVHPRVGGEHASERSLFGLRCGSSPRGRGTRTYHESGGHVERFIPAWAGNTHVQVPFGGRLPVHPRVGGEHMERLRFWRGQWGSSPRGRGTLLSVDY